MINQPIINIAEIFVRKNVNKVVISPGSRSAPLTLAFARHPQIEVRMIPDERSAAFIALGMALTQNNLPVGLVCTSGSAVLNYYPAIAEAYFQQIPLIILTADRPKEWIGQYDGQTIYQNEVYSGHIKKSFELNADFSHKDSVWYAERIISEAINHSLELPRGPVHINIPLREPLYPSVNEKIQFEEHVKVIDCLKSILTLSNEQIASLGTSITAFEKVLIVGGQGNFDKEDINALEVFVRANKIPLVGDILSNLHPIDSANHLPDVFLNGENSQLLQTLQPDLLITFGNSVISKNLKLFLRKFGPKEHWHLQEAGDYADTFQSLTKVIRVKASAFFSQLSQNDMLRKQSASQQSYYDNWNELNRNTNNQIKSFFPREPFSEFETTKMVIENLPADSLFHLANSMAVRYANFIGLKGKEGVSVFSNRGTSGIDGCTSTAVGAAFTTDRPVVLLTGDMAFFYDRNAFWHNYSTANLRVIILNNHGGGIFGLIDGPGELPEREEYFETTQKLRAANTAKDFDLDYYFCDNREDLRLILKTFFEASSKGKILEVETDKQSNKEIFRAFKDYFKNQ